MPILKGGKIKMYVCKECGNYYSFTGSSIVFAKNKLNPTGKNKYEEETDLEYEEIDFINCVECGSNSVAEVVAEELPQQLQDQIYNTLTMGCIENDIMKELKNFVK